MCFSIGSCCYCISLEIGAQIISIFSLLVALAETGYSAHSAVTLPLTEIKMVTVFVVVAVLALFEAFCACLLIKGVFSKKANCTVPWLVLAWVKSIACLAVASFGIALLVVQSTRPPPPSPPVETNSTTIAPPETTTGADQTVPEDDITKWTITFSIIVAVCIIQAFLLMYFAVVVNSRRKQILQDDYSHYAPVRSDSIVRNYFIPITRPDQNQ